MTRPGLSNPIDWGVCLVTDRHQTAGRDLLTVVGQALDAGVRAVQLREKDLSALEVFRLGERLIAMTRATGAELIINDRIDVAIALGADAVQLTRGSLPPGIARALVGQDRLVGVSCHSLDDVREAVANQVDYVILGPVYETSSKATYGPPIGPEIVRQARAICSLPILAIGGITAGRVNEVIQAGANGVVVISAILSAPDPSAAAAELLAQLRQQAPEKTKSRKRAKV